MDNKFYLIISKNTSQMLAINKLLQKENIPTDFVPTPPETGTVCAIAVKLGENFLDKAKDIISAEKFEFSIIEDRKFKLQGLIDKKLGNVVTKEFLNILKKIENGDELEKLDIVYLLGTSIKKEIDTIYDAANRIRHEMVGDIVEIRGAIEFSNYCKKSCKYCGINALNDTVTRYRMNEDEIMEVVNYLQELGIKTVILQSGEDYHWSTERIIGIVKRIKTEIGMRITLSVGERTKEEYVALKNAGGDNFLLKIETMNRELFKEIHPDDDYDHRLLCAKWLKELGYLTGSGNIIGLPGQTLFDIADDIQYFKDEGIHMIGLGPFIPAKGTPYENEPHGDVDLTLRTIAVTRIVCKKVFIPSTTALASLDVDAQVMALNAGANSIMMVNTPSKYRDSYRIYDNKTPVDLEASIYAVNKAGRQMPKYLKLPK